MRVAAFVPQTRAEGPGLRSALWVQGCSLRCPGCCNPELFDAAGGRSTAIATVDQWLAQARRDTQELEGLTILGGEPLEQIEATAAVARVAAAHGLGVIVFTGYTIDQARALPGFAALWDHVDTLVDGPFDRRVPETTGRVVLGSGNQTLVHRTARYADPAAWSGPARVEAHVDATGGIGLHGSPRLVARLRRHLTP